MLYKELHTQRGDNSWSEVTSTENKEKYRLPITLVCLQILCMLSESYAVGVLYSCNSRQLHLCSAFVLLTVKSEQ